MARVRDVEIHEVPEEVRPTYARFATEYGPFLNQVKVFAHRPPAVKHIMGLLLDLVSADRGALGAQNRMDLPIAEPRIPLGQIVDSTNKLGFFDPA
jgi:hypothetical protein